MDVFDNCRICLREISHEPIKMTRLILRFLEQSLQLINLIKPIPQENVKLNLCAPCFNRISEFQDFLEQCKDSDEFWGTQFENLKKDAVEAFRFEESELVPLSDEGNSLVADTTVSTTEVKTVTLHSEEENYENGFNSPELGIEQNLQGKEKQNILHISSQIITEDEIESTQIDDFNSINLSNWEDDTNHDSEITKNLQDECSANINEDEEIIEYEYKIEEEEEMEFENFSDQEDTESQDACVDYRSFAYEKVESEKSGEGTTIPETIDENLEQTETTNNTFFLTTSIDDNGKVKMSYKCPKCDKSFNRIYDIESHYNIHNGVKPFTCDVCGKSFRQKNILTTHQALHFGKKVECAECGKKFARRSQLILHNRMHRDEKPFVCNIDNCQAAFRQRKQLIDHSFIHTGEKNFQCGTCSKSFHTRKRLQDHIYKVHSQHRYCCELCEKAFLKPHMLKHHMVSVHNVEMEDVSHLKTLIDVLKPIKKRL